MSPTEHLDSFGDPEESPCPQRDLQERRDRQRLQHLSVAVHHSGKSDDMVVRSIKKELRAFVRRSLEQLPTYIDQNDPRNSNFQGTYVDENQRTKYFDYNAFVAHVSSRFHKWLTSGVDELTHPLDPDISFTPLACQGTRLN